MGPSQSTIVTRALGLACRFNPRTAQLGNERGVRGNDEQTLPATDGPPGQSHPSEPWDGLRTRMADMDAVRKICT